MSDFQVVQQVAAEMVRKARNGIYYGSPRPLMEALGGSSGPRYELLLSMGFTPIKKGPNGQWQIP